MITINKEILSLTIIEYLNIIYSIFKNIYNAKFGKCLDHKLSNADLQEELPNPSFFDPNLESHYNIFFLKIYKYNYYKLQINN